MIVKTQCPVIVFIEVNDSRRNNCFSRADQGIDDIIVNVILKVYAFLTCFYIV